MLSFPSLRKHEVGKQQVTVREIRVQLCKEEVGATKTKGTKHESRTFLWRVQTKKSKPHEEMLLSCRVTKVIVLGRTLIAKHSLQQNKQIAPFSLKCKLVHLHRLAGTSDGSYWSPSWVFIDQLFHRAPTSYRFFAHGPSAALIEASRIFVPLLQIILIFLYISFSLNSCCP